MAKRAKRGAGPVATTAREAGRSGRRTQSNERVGVGGRKAVGGKKGGAEGVNRRGVSKRTEARRNAAEGRLISEFRKVAKISSSGCWVFLGLAESGDSRWDMSLDVRSFVGNDNDGAAFAESARTVKRWGNPRTMRRWAQVCECMSSTHRIRILVKLFEGPATYQSLCKTTELKAGPLYHHIGVLRTAGMVGPKLRDMYELTRGGRNLVLAALPLSKMVSDRRRRIVPVIAT